MCELDANGYDFKCLCLVGYVLGDNGFTCEGTVPLRLKVAAKRAPSALRVHFRVPNQNGKANESTNESNSNLIHALVVD